MGYNYTYDDVITVARQQYNVNAESTVLQQAMNSAIALMWKAYDWRGSVVPFPPFWLVGGEQDYFAPEYCVPTDFYGLREVYLVNLTASIPIRTPLDVVENLELTSLLSYPQSIAYRGSVSGFRVHPCPNYGVSSPQWMIDGSYKKQPPRFTRSDIGSTLPWEDVYFQCLVEAVAYTMLRATGRRADAQAQFANFVFELKSCAEAENLELGEPTVHPNRPLLPFGTGGAGFNGGVWSL